MQNKTDKGTSLVSKSLPVVNSNSVNRSFSETKANGYVSSGEKSAFAHRSSLLFGRYTQRPYFH